MGWESYSSFSLFLIYVTKEKAVLGETGKSPALVPPSATPVTLGLAGSPLLQVLWD